MYHVIKHKFETKKENLKKNVKNYLLNEEIAVKLIHLIKVLKFYNVKNGRSIQ